MTDKVENVYRAFYKLLCGDERFYIEHRPGCQRAKLNVPIDEAPCDCYIFWWFDQGWKAHEE